MKERSLLCPDSKILEQTSSTSSLGTLSFYLQNNSWIVIGSKSSLHHLCNFCPHSLTIFSILLPQTLRSLALVAIPTINQKINKLDQLNAWRINDRSSCCWLDELDELDVVCEEQMNVCQFICQAIDKYQEEKGSKHRTMGHPAFYGTFAWMVVVQFYSKSSVV